VVSGLLLGPLHRGSIILFMRLIIRLGAGVSGEDGLVLVSERLNSFGESDTWLRCLFLTHER
jgi:hypothetical protein